MFKTLERFSKKAIKMSIHVFVHSPRNWTEDSKLGLASLILSVSKTPNVKQLIVGDSPSTLLDKVPRSVSLLIKPRPSLKDFYELVKEMSSSLPPTDFLVIVPELSQMIVPEAVHSAGLALRLCDYVFFTENLDGLVSVKFAELRHWTLGSSPSGPAVMTKCSTFLQDQEEFLEESCFDVLRVLKKRVLASPVPSLACPLPIKVQPPIIPWKQVHDAIKSAMF